MSRYEGLERDYEMEIHEERMSSLKEEVVSNIKEFSKNVPSETQLEEWFSNYECECPCGCLVEVDGHCEVHNQDSWFITLGIM